MQLKSKTPLAIKDSRNLTTFFKGIAILLVILVHSQLRFSLTSAQTAVQRFGQMGCQIFLVLSSFGLCHSFLKEVPDWVPHMKKRISSIAIGYWGAILITAIYRIIRALITKTGVLSGVNIPGIIANALFLNGLIPIGGINNSVVRGGWYVGTTVILYGLFPLLYKIYFMDKKAWVKHRVWLFPLAVLFVTAPFAMISGFIHPALACNNNSFVYFSFINQLTPFSFGLVLFDICQRYGKKKYAPFCAIMLLILAIILFFGQYRYSFVFCPTVVAAGFVLLFWYLLNSQKFYNSINNNSNKVVQIINKFGKISFPIYLTHTFIVYDFSTICLTLLRRIYPVDFLWYLILLPIEYGLIYFIGSLYNKCISYIEMRKKAAE